MNLNHLLITLSILLPMFAPLPVLAQKPVQLSIGEAIEIAVKGNRDLQSSRLSIRYADAQVDEAYSSAYPSLNASLGYSRYLQKPVFYFPGSDGISRPVSIGSDNQITGSVSVNQIVYNSAALTAKKTAEVYSQISRQQLRSRTSDIILNVRKAYYTALLARDVLRVNQALLENAQENHRTVSIFYKAGARPEFDMIRAEVAASNLQPVVVQARDNYEMTLDNLRLLLGMDQSQQIDLTGSLVGPVSDAMAQPGYDTARKILDQYNPQLQSLRLNAEVNKWVIKLKESDYYPTVSVFGSYQLQAQSDKFSDLSFHPTSLVGLSLGYNLFNWWRTRAQVQEATMQSQQSQLQLEQAGSGLAIQLESVMRRINYARNRIDVNQKTITLAERGYAIATANYKAGSGTQLQISDADLALSQARLNQLTAVYDYNIGTAELEGLLGDRCQITEDGSDVKYSGK